MKVRFVDAWIHECSDCEGQRVMVQFETELGRQGESILRWCACNPIGKLFDVPVSQGDLNPDTEKA